MRTRQYVLSNFSISVFFLFDVFYAREFLYFSLFSLPDKYTDCGGKQCVKVLKRISDKLESNTVQHYFPLKNYQKEITLQLIFNVHQF